MITYKNVRILKPYKEPFRQVPRTGLTKQWRDLLKVMVRHMGQGGAVTMVQNGNYANVELLK